MLFLLTKTNQILVNVKVLTEVCFDLILAPDNLSELIEI
jgi:hypothetical protein